jgi:hypothetical protein
LAHQIAVTAAVSTIVSESRWRWRRRTDLLFGRWKRRHGDLRDRLRDRLYARRSRRLRGPSSCGDGSDQHDAANKDAEQDQQKTADMRLLRLRWSFEGWLPSVATSYATEHDVLPADGAGQKTERAEEESSLECGAELEAPGASGQMR